MNNTLNISETFLSVQCEGATTGVPSRFIRLKGCNLSCGLSKMHLSEVLKAGQGNTQSGSFIGDLEQSKRATWTCDSVPVWLFGDGWSFERLYDELAANRVSETETELDWIAQGRVHIIWTGGEPTMPLHQKAIVNWLEYAELRYTTEKPQTPFRPNNEIETNGTIPISESLMRRLFLITCSAKLANSGMTAQQRIKPDALKTIITKHRLNTFNHNGFEVFPVYQFKFVVSTEQDFIDAKSEYIDPFQIPWENIVLMPGLDNQIDFHERTRFILELAKKHGVRGLTRLHISAYNQATGV